MTEKERESNVLEQIRKLLEPTFYCKTALWDALNYAERNIDDDACYNPVEELRDEYDKGLKKDSEMGAKLVRLEHENQALQTHLDEKDEEIRKMEHLYNSKVAECEQLEQNAHDAGEMYCGLEAECAELSAEVRKLKAEIVRMRMERMTEDDMAKLYDKTEGAN